VSFLTSSRPVLRYIWNEPSNRGQRLCRIARGVGWQLHKRLSRRPKIVRLWNGRLFLADPADDMASFVFYARIFDSRHALFVARATERGAMVDVGANVGLFTLQLSHLFDEAVLYEASPEAARKAQDNMARNRLDRFRVRAVAVGDRDGRILFASVAPTGLTNRMIDEPAEARGPVSEVPVTTLDRDLDAKFRQRLSFLKIDVEGAEAKVLAGARETLAASPHLLIMFERLKRTPLPPLLDLLAECGYAVFALSGGVPDRSERAIGGAHDLFACRAERIDMLSRRVGETGRG
jgi:FkbM family methyltransferase